MNYELDLLSVSFNRWTYHHKEEFHLASRLPVFRAAALFTDSSGS